MNIYTIIKSNYRDIYLYTCSGKICARTTCTAWFNGRSGKSTTCHEQEESISESGSSGPIRELGGAWVRSETTKNSEQRRENIYDGYLFSDCHQRGYIKFTFTAARRTRKSGSGRRKSKVRVLQRQFCVTPWDHGDSGSGRFRARNVQEGIGRT